MGPLPETGALPTRVTVGSLTPEEVRANAAINNKAIFESTKTCRDTKVAQAVYDATVAERDRGWLEGPIDFNSLPQGAVLTRRFGVEQTSFDVNVGSVKKVRPIDDYTESLVNLTNSSTNNFCRVSQALHWLGMIIMTFHWSCFYDDFFITGNSAESRHLDMMQKGFFALLSWETSAEKGGAFQAVAKALGVQFSFADSSSGLLSVCNTEGRIKEVCDQIQFFLERGKASSAELATLRGRLLFADSHIFGRRSKQSMNVLSLACAKTGSISFNQDLVSTLTCLTDRVLRGAPRLVHGTHRNKYLLFADACHEEGGAGLGGILYGPTKRRLVRRMA